jgi:transposase
LKIAVARILCDGKRTRTRSFTEPLSHYLFDDRFGRPGKVEALVKYTRANFLTPMPHAASFAALNATLEQRCRDLPEGRGDDPVVTLSFRLGQNGNNSSHEPYT